MSAVWKRAQRRPSPSAAVSPDDRTAAVNTAEPAFRRDLAAFLRKRGGAIAHEVAAAYRQARKDDADRIQRVMAALELGDWSEISDSAKAYLVDVFQAGGEAALEDVLKRGAAALFDALNPRATAYAASRGAELVTLVSDSTKEGLRGLIEAAFEDGMTPAQLAAEIRGSYWFSEDRADMIARTELGMAHVQGSLEGWKESGVVGGKSVLLSNDHEGDDECDDAEAEGVIPIDQEFAEGDPPIHPRCNCSVVPELIEGYDD